MSNTIGRSLSVPITFLVAYCLLAICGPVGAQQSGKDRRAFSFEALEANRVETARPYLPFLNVDSMHCGIYCLDAGAKDGQSPHQQDEIYYVESGVAKISIEGKDYDLKKGSIVFVPANAPHHFHTITENLKTLVFFSKGPVTKTKEEQAEKDDQALHHSTESAMTFNATMDSVTDANLFDSHGWICTADSIARKTTKDGNHVKDVSIVNGEGVSGDCLRFLAKTKQVLFYKSKDAANFSPRPDWSGSISFWLRLDPAKDLGDGFCDPLQIAGRKWNDGAIWVDFENVQPRTFRLGVFSDFEKWNPKGLKWEQIPAEDRPLVVVNNPPFSSEQWTHVAITFSDINSTRNKKSNAKLYLNGKLQGSIDRRIEISWDRDHDPPPAIMLGLNYVGDMDELEVYNRALTAAEVEFIDRSNRKGN